MNNPSTLFVLKHKRIYDVETYDTKSIHSGLYNSAMFVNDMLNDNGITSHLVQVIDNNCINKYVTKYKPTDVIIEAIWVVPAKFKILAKLHPNVRWIIRLHSELPFIANEGNAIDWIYEYSELSKEFNIAIAPNTQKMYNDLQSIGINNLIYLPNYYPVKGARFRLPKFKKYINIGCFGAIRPMKNQLIQAVAAVRFGNEMNKQVRFHINTERIEKGDNALKNIRALFERNPQHVLVEHPWYSHDDFLQLVRRMDMGLQVSFNETFNIVGADFVSNNIPLIGSNEIPWLSSFYQTATTDVEEMVSDMKRAYRLRWFNAQRLNLMGLKEYVNASEEEWITAFRGLGGCGL